MSNSFFENLIHRFIIKELERKKIWRIIKISGDQFFSQTEFAWRTIGVLQTFQPHWTWKSFLSQHCSSRKRCWILTSKKISHSRKVALSAVIFFRAFSFFGASTECDNDDMLTARFGMFRGTYASQQAFDKRLFWKTLYVGARCFSQKYLKLESFSINFYLFTQFFDFKISSKWYYQDFVIFIPHNFCFNTCNNKLSFQFLAFIFNNKR